MNPAAAAALRWRGLTRCPPDLAKLRLNHLFVRPFAYLDHALVVPFPWFRNTENVLACRHVGQYHSARTPNASLSFIVYVDLRTYRSQHDETRHTGTFGFVDVLGSLFKLFDPTCDGLVPYVRFDLKRPHNYLFDIGRNIGPEGGKGRRLVHYFLHYKLHHVTGKGRFASQH